LLRHRAFRLALVCSTVLAAGLAGCTSSLQVFEDKNEGGWFSKPLDVFGKPDWARTAEAKTAQLGPSGPVGPEELVNPDGSCAPPAAPVAAPAPAQPAPAAQASAEPGPHLEPGGPVVAPAPLLGGIALGMTECQAVRRAGQPSNISISADDKGERRTVITYIGGSWPGIYTFNAGRLKIVERAPEPPKPVKPAPKKKNTKPKTAQHPAATVQ
jgi:hypothetical protein